MEGWPVWAAPRPRATRRSPLRGREPGPTPGDGFPIGVGNDGWGEGVRDVSAPVLDSLRGIGMGGGLLFANCARRVLI